MSIKYIGAPIKEGCTIEGADQGMEVLKKIFSFDEIVEVIEQPEAGDRHLISPNTIADFTRRLKEAVGSRKNDFVVTIGGDHSLAIGSVAGSYDEGMGLVWVDAHGDSNTDTTTITGRIHGMPVSVLQGVGSDILTNVCGDCRIMPENIVLFGIRSLDPLEELLLRQRNIRVVYYQDILQKGLDACINDVLKQMKDRKVYLSFDLDSIDPNVCTGVNTPVASGFSKTEALGLMTEFLKNLNIVGMDIVEYNPLNDDGGTLEILSEFKKIIERYKGGRHE